MTSGIHMVRLIDDLLMISTLDANAIQLRPEPVDPVSLCAECIGMVRTRADEKGLELRFESDFPDHVQVIADPARLTQILVNLLSNAIKFTEKGHVRLSLSAELVAEMAVLKLVVADTGPGIPPEKRREVFGRFHQLDGSIRRNHEGVGLGLAIIHSLLDMMDGSIFVETAPEGGAAFLVTLAFPCAVPSDQAG